MRRVLVGLIVALAGATAHGADPCGGKVIASVLSYDRAARQGFGLLVNQCGRPVAAEVLVMANNRDGFVVAKLRTYVHASAEPLSVIRVDLPFVQSVVALSGYAVEVAAATPTTRRAARRAFNPADIGLDETGSSEIN
jgi:hypothetical protein